MLSEWSFQKKILNIIPLIPVYAIILTVTFAFTNYYALNGEFTIWKVLLVPAFYLSFSMVCYNHTKSMIVSPGIVESSYTIDVETINNTQDPVNNDELFCKKCNHSRPIRSHHCKVCNRCILKMDHHCPWVANCVGFYNQKFFYLFLFYAVLGDFLASICLVPQIYLIDEKISKMKPDASFTERYEPFIVVIAFMMSIAMTMSIGFLFAMQTWMISSNLTTIENRMYKDKKNNPYFTNDKLHNLSIVLGMESKWEWFWPVFEPNVYNNGTSYEKPPGEFNLNLSSQFKSIDKGNPNNQII